MNSTSFIPLATAKRELTAIETKLNVLRRRLDDLSNGQSYIDLKAGRAIRHHALQTPSTQSLISRLQASQQTNP